MCHEHALYREDHHPPEALSWILRLRSGFPEQSAKFGLSLDSLAVLGVFQHRRVGSQALRCLCLTSKTMFIIIIFFKHIDVEAAEMYGMRFGAEPVESVLHTL